MVEKHNVRPQNIRNVIVAIVGTAVVWKGSGLLEAASERLSLYYRLPEIVQGAIVVAIGSSFPELATNRDLVDKAAQFYMIAVAVLLLTFSFAVIYNPVESTGGELQGELTRWLVLLPLLLYVIYVFVQYQDTMDYQSDADVSHIRPGREWGNWPPGWR